MKNNKDIVFNEDIVLKEKNGYMIVCNSANGKWIRIKKEKYIEFIECEIKRKEFIEILRSKYDFFEKEKEIIEQSNLKSVYFSVTKKCNMACSFCTMNSSNETSTQKDISLKKIKSVVIPKLVKLNPRSIVISGGEPLIRDDILEILEEFKLSFGKEKILLQTNGTLLNLSMLEKIKNSIGIIEISLEHIFSDETLLLQTKKIFSFLKSSDIVLAASFVVDKNTKKYLFEAIDLCYEYNVIFNMRIVSPLGRAIENEYNAITFESKDILNIYYNAIEHILKNKYFVDNIASSFVGEIVQPKPHCGAFGNVMSINSDGIIYMCGNFKELDYSMGNILTDSLSEIVYNLEDKMNSKKHKEIFYVHENILCKECELRFFCSGHCPAEIVENENNISNIIEKCIAKRVFIEYAIFYYEKNMSYEENLKIFKKYLESTDLIEK